MGSGPARPVGVVVYEAPSSDDSEKDRVLSGHVGNAFNETLQAVGLKRDSLYVLPAVCCTPPTKKDWKHLGKAIDACAPAFMSQVQSYADLPVLALGQWALYAWTGKRKAIDNARGFVRDVKLRSLDVAGRNEAVSEEAGPGVDEPSEVFDSAND